MRLATLSRRVGSNLKMVKFFIQHLWMLHDVVVVWPGSSNNVTPGYAHKFDFQLATRCKVTTGWPNTCNMMRPTMLRSVAFKCCYSLAGAQGGESLLMPFSSPEAALLLVSTKNRDLWPGPTTEVRDSRTSRHSAHAQS